MKDTPITIKQHELFTLMFWAMFGLQRATGGSKLTALYTIFKQHAGIMKMEESNFTNPEAQLGKFNTKKGK